jgi:hypothetical protein
MAFIQMAPIVNQSPGQNDAQEIYFAQVNFPLPDLVARRPP